MLPSYPAPPWLSEYHPGKQKKIHINFVTKDVLESSKLDNKEAALILSIASKG